MKTILKYFSLLIFFTIVSKSVLAQDKIVKVNNDTLRVKIMQITLDKIKFRYHGMKSGQVMEIPKNQVKQIIYENGSSLTIVYNLFDVSKDLMIKDRFRAVKIDICAPLLNHITVAYEHKLRLGMNFEVKGGYIGWRVNKTLDKTEGFIGKVSLRFLKNTNTIRKGLKYIHPMKGSYVKPEIAFSRYTSIEEGHKINFSNIYASINFGRQYILGNVICLDFFGGAGVGYQLNSRGANSSNQAKGDDFSYCYSHLYFGKKLPIILTGGLMMGYVF